MGRYDYYPVPEGYDPRRWRVAQLRASFKIHLTTYLMVNGFLIGVWYITDREGYFWPIWPLLGWGIGLASHGLSAYSSSGGESAVEKEYRKMEGK